MHPFMAAELDRFDLDAALARGLLPLVAAAERPEDVLRAYASLYLDEEVRLEGWARNVGAFARFLEAVSFSHGTVLNVADVARECQVERKTVAGYLDVLDDLLLSFRVPVFTRRARRATTTHAKLFIFDAGVYRSLRLSGPLDRLEEIEGVALEGLVAQHLGRGSRIARATRSCSSGGRVRAWRSISCSTGRARSTPWRSRIRHAFDRTTCAASKLLVSTIRGRRSRSCTGAHAASGGDASGCCR
jgi:predicted AAA+ superfamily ATPase